MDVCVLGAGGEGIKAYQVYPHWGSKIPQAEWPEMPLVGLADQGDNCHK